MKVEFDWKNFEHNKPYIGSLCVLRQTNSISDSKDILTLAKYYGTKDEIHKSRKIKYHIFTECKELDFRRFKIVNKNFHIPITPKILSTKGVNPYNFDWDYYCGDWLDD